MKQRIKVGDTTVYLTECPKFGDTHRKLNEDKIAAVIALGGVGFIVAIGLGPFLGASFALTSVSTYLGGNLLLFGAMGAGAAAVGLIKKIEKTSLFECRKCGCTKLLK